MPLSLVEISKKKRRQEKDSTPVIANTKAPLKKRFGSKTAMPWTGSDLSARPAKSRRRLDVDAAMNEDWLSLHEEPLFWLNTEAETRSKLAAIQDRLLEFEENLHATISQSLKVVKAVFCNQV
jgi:hypothetical protein